MIRKRRKFGLVFLVGGCLILLLMAVKTVRDANSWSSTHKVAPVIHTTEQVMTIGSSVTRGWMDTGWKAWKKGWFGGYIVRGFTSLSKATPNHYVIVDHTIVGANSSQMTTLYKGEMTRWLRTVRPNVVVISWGLLNDALPKTPLSTFRAHIHHEIANVLAHHAVVLMVTPPVTQASLTTYKTQFAVYLTAELQVAQSFHNNNVYEIDLYNQMKKYMEVHHQNIDQYIGNSWHPNAAGHILAGLLLYHDLLTQFGSKPIAFHA